MSFHVGKENLIVQSNFSMKNSSQQMLRNIAHF